MNGIRKVRAAIEAAKAKKLRVKKNLAIALEDSGALFRFGCPVKLPLKDGREVSLDLQPTLFDSEEGHDGYCHIAITEGPDDGTIVNHGDYGFEMCPEPKLVLEAIENKLQRELALLEEWNERVIEITHSLV
jgi:hypothetical protein